ncbi:helix-turn-helix transcriptional regulator [bacterium]|nr:helix-turn-helix transcriptional regulator [bacterium]
MYLRGIRENKGITQEKLANGIGTTKSNISLIETGKLKISIEKAEKIANFLGCRISDIVGETKFDPNFKRIDFIQIPLFSNALKDKYKQGYFENRENKLLIQFDTNILESLDIKDFDKNKLFYVKMVGDTMLPLIAHDDNILISLEVSKETIRSNRIYLINENGRLSIKRIMRENPISDDIIIKDDNETSNNYNKYPAKISELSGDFLIGRVIYIGKRIY